MNSMSSGKFMWPPTRESKWQKQMRSSAKLEVVERVRPAALLTAHPSRVMQVSSSTAFVSRIHKFVTKAASCRPLTFSTS